MMDSNRMMRYEANKKSAGVAYLLWFFLGMLGAHRFYLNKGGSGAAILILTVLSFILMAAAIGLLTIWVSILWVLLDALLIPGMVRDYNNKLVDMLA